MQNNTHPLLKTTIHLSNTILEEIIECLYCNGIDTFEIIDHECCLHPNPPPKGQTLIIAYIPFEMEPRLKSVLDSYPSKDMMHRRIYHLSFQPFTDTQWQENWKRYFKPIIVGNRFYIRPVWAEKPSSSEFIDIQINPGLAFGTGTHGTTQIALELLLHCIETIGSEGKQMLDLGTGSGILAIAGAGLNIEKITACDNDADAIENARENVALNRENHRICLLQSDISAISGAYDIVIANIISTMLLNNERHLFRQTKMGGSLILSGILQEEFRSFLPKFLGNVWILKEEIRRDEWIGILLQKM